MQILLLLALLTSQQHNINIPEARPEMTKIKVFMTSPEIATGAAVDAGTPKPAYLTFDDGPSDKTREILAVLDKYNIKATFFVNGPYMDPDPVLYQEMINAGHALANHTYSHKYSKIYQSKTAFLADVDKLDQYLQENFGYTTRLFRFPGGSNNSVSRKYGGTAIMPAVRQAILDRGYYYFDWNVDPGNTLASPEKIATKVLTQAKNKKRVIVLLHDHWGQGNTIQALPTIIEGLRKQGYEFYLLDENVEPIRQR